jgi:phosphoadenosine phosphosulfate reductase
MIEKHNRSILKAISWRFFGSIDTILVSLLITKSVKLAASIGFIEIFTKMILYYFHERLWNKTNFGKISLNEQDKKEFKMEDIQGLNSIFNDAPAEEILKYFLKKFNGKIALASSLSIEDQVITDMILKIDRDAKIFTLDTGRLPYETYKLIEQTNSFFDFKMDIVFPQSGLVENMVKQKGVNLFYNNVEERKLCCYIRKVEPLKRAMQGLDAWICGLRKEQSVTRKNLNVVELDESNGILKISPLLNWGEDKVWQYIKEKGIPYNKLYDKNYKSIGCAPCTRAVKDGEDIRSGRWWWENPETKECGLHLSVVQ